MEQNPEFNASLAQETKKITDWDKEPSVMALQEDLAIAKPGHDSTVSKISRWNDLRNIDGAAKPAIKHKHRSKVQPKLIRKNNEWRYSALTEPFLSSEKVFSITPRTFEDGPAAQQNMLLLEWQFAEKLDKVAFIDEYVRTVVDEGTCVVRIGWERFSHEETKQIPQYEYHPIEDESELGMIQQAMQLKEEDPRGFSELPESLQESALYSMEVQAPLMAIQIGVEEVTEEVLDENRPTLDIIHYENFYLDPSCSGDIDNANFAIVTFETSKAELIKDGRYSNLDQVLWSANTTVSQPDHSTTTDDSQEFKDTLRKRVVAYEYWGFYDIHGDDSLVPIVATWIGNTMIRMEENPYPDKKIPFVLAQYMPVKRSTHGEPDAELLEDNQRIIGALTRGMIDSMGRSANGQVGFAKGVLDPINRRRYDAGMDYEYNLVSDPRQGMFEHSFPTLPASALNMLQLQNQDAESMSGVKAFAGGLSGEAYGDVAAGIRGMLDASSKREMAILRRLAKGLMKMAKKIAAMNAVFLGEEEVIRVTNEKFVTVKREDLQGNFDFKVDIATAEVDEAKAQDLAFMLQTMGNTMDTGMTQMILSDIARLKRMPELATKIERFQPQPDPMEEKKKQIELAEMELELQKIQSEIELNKAKARKTLADAEESDLNFIEQESGTKHARDIDKVSAQAEANQGLEITKALLDPTEPKSYSQIDAAKQWKHYSDSLTNP